MSHASTNLSNFIFTRIIHKLSFPFEENSVIYEEFWSSQIHHKLLDLDGFTD